jgi:hypothetical protein
MNTCPFTEWVKGAMKAGLIFSGIQEVYQENIFLKTG